MWLRQERIHAKIEAALVGRKLLVELTGFDQGLKIDGGFRSRGPVRDLVISERGAAAARLPLGPVRLPGDPCRGGMSSNLMVILHVPARAAGLVRRVM